MAYVPSTLALKTSSGVVRIELPREHSLQFINGGILITIGTREDYCELGKKLDNVNIKYRTRFALLKFIIPDIIFEVKPKTNILI